MTEFVKIDGGMRLGTEVIKGERSRAWDTFVQHYLRFVGEKVTELQGEGSGLMPDEAVELEKTLAVVVDAGAKSVVTTRGVDLTKQFVGDVPVEVEMVYGLNGPFWRFRIGTGKWDSERYQTREAAMSAAVEKVRGEVDETDSLTRHEPD